MKKVYLFRRTVFDCKQATLLSIKKAEGKITFLERVKLSYHLLYCDPCRQFIKQWNQLDRLQRNVDAESVQPTFSLPEVSRGRIQGEIDRLNS
jgi:predicted anti-sigma-YlaC factor YlaD